MSNDHSIRQRPGPPEWSRNLYSSGDSLRCHVPLPILPIALVSLPASHLPEPLRCPLPHARQLANRLATVRSGPRPEPFLETVKKTGPYGLVNWDRSPDRKIRSGLGKNGPVSSSKWRPIKRPDRTVRYSGTAVQSGLSIGRTGLYSPV